MTPKLQPWKTETDGHIWAGFKHGDKLALEFIYRTHAKALFAYGMKIVGNRNLVKDCIQELFVELWKSRHKLSDTNNIKFYLLKALKFKIQYQLKREYRLSDFADFDSSSPLSISHSYEDELIETQTLQEVKIKVTSLIKQLPARQKEIIHLLFYEGLSYEEISSIMNIHTQSVYTLVWKAIASLKKRLLTLLPVVIPLFTLL